MSPLLFDTHSFLWWDSEPGKLSEAALAALHNPQNELLLSVVSLWEIAIKVQIGKMTIRRPLREIVEEQMRENQVRLLSVSAEHIFAIESLPPLHRDPFDRLLIAQTNSERAILVTADHMVQQYPVNFLW